MSLAIYPFAEARAPTGHSERLNINHGDRSRVIESARQSAKPSQRRRRSHRIPNANACRKR